MPRSEYLWVISKSGRPVAAFTVKHELASWLFRLGSVGGLSGVRMRDGMWHQAGKEVAKPQPVDLVELYEAGYKKELSQWQQLKPEYRGEKPECKERWEHRVNSSEQCGKCFRKSVRAKELWEGGGIECVYPGCYWWFCY